MSPRRLRSVPIPAQDPPARLHRVAGIGTTTLDQRIVIALQLSGRASWREVAALVGASESTVARRARALMASGVIRTTVLPDPQRCGFGRPVLVQLACAPDRARALAQQLARRPDVRFVALVTGAYDIVAELIIDSDHNLVRILVDELGGMKGLIRTITESVLRNFKMAYDWSRPLLEAEVPLPPPADIDVRAPLEPVALDALDLALIEQLREDGRRSYRDLAASLQVSESAVRRRVERLIASGCVTPVTLVDPRFLGYEVEVFVSLRVELAQLEEVAAALVSRPEVRYLSATSGYSDLVAEVILRSQDDLYAFRTHLLGGLAGVREVEMALELETLKRAYLPPATLEAGQDTR